jgi:general secretion pathway protein N
MRARNRTNLLLLLIWLGLAGWVAYQWLNPPPPPTVPAGAAGGVEPDIEVEPFQPPRIADLDYYTETVERPVFYPERRPPEPESEVVVQAPEPPPAPDVELTLVGVMLTGEATAALIRDGDTNRVARLNLGEEVADWRLEQIQPQRVTLSRGDRTRELELVRNQRAPSRPVRTVDVRRSRAVSGEDTTTDEPLPDDEESPDGEESVDPQQLIEQLLQRQQSG